MVKSMVDIRHISYSKNKGQNTKWTPCIIVDQNGVALN